LQQLLEHQACGEHLIGPQQGVAGDELLKGSGDGRFLGGLSTHPEGSIEQLLVESKIRGQG